MVLDFKQIKEEHPIEKVAERLGLTLKPHGNQLRGPCFSGQGDERSLVITSSKGQFYSFALKKGGDCISLVALVKEIPLRAAAEWIAGKEPEKREPTPKPPQRQAETGVAEEPSDGFKPLPYLVPDHELCTAVGFDPDFCTTHGIGYAPRGVMRGCIAIPVRSSKGKLLGYIGVTDCRLPSQWHE